jgi:hypothetical protein
MRASLITSGAGAQSSVRERGEPGEAECCSQELAALIEQGRVNRRSRSASPLRVHFGVGAITALSASPASHGP